MTTNNRIPPRERDAILQSLAAGVTPRRGLQHIHVGRADELDALGGDLDRIADGGSSIRLIIGPYGAGKTFFAELIRAMALKLGLVTIHADLTPDRRLYSSSGHGRALYTELAHNMATRSQPEGGALSAVVERFVTCARQVAQERGDPADLVIHEHLAHFTDLVGGFDFAEVIASYYRGCEEDDDELSRSSIRWLRGEYSTRREARNALGVRQIIDDATMYDALKLLARFVRAAGYKGLLIVLDEMVNLYKLTHTSARRSNYEKVLSIVNDGLQGGTEYMGIVMAGTPEFLTDPRRGLFSYDALATRLEENQFAQNGLKDLSGPVIRLSNLEPEGLHHLLEKIRHVQAYGREEDYLLPDDALKAFMTHCSKRIGANYFQTPRTSIRAFVQLLAVLEQNPKADWRAILGSVEVARDMGAGPQITVPESDGPVSATDLEAFTL